MKQFANNKKKEPPEIMLVATLFPQFSDHVLNILYSKLNSKPQKILSDQLKCILKRREKCRTQNKNQSIPSAGFGYWVRSQTQINIWILIK